MSRRIKIGLTRDYLDKDGKFMLPGTGLRLLQESPDIEYEVFSELLAEVTPEQIEGFDIVITRNFSKWTERSLTGNNQLISIHRSGVGYDRIDVPALTNAGVLLCITPDAVRRTIAVAILTFILALSTRLFIKHRLTSEGKWAEVSNYHGYGLVDKTLGSVGVGNIGREIFELAKPLGMRYIACDPYVRQEAVNSIGVKLVNMDTLLAESDFLNISCPLNEETRNMIGVKELRKMKKTVFLINTARGSIVNEKALIKALQEGWIHGAALDVFDQEPTPPDNPLLKLDNVIVTAHAMAFTDEFLEKVWNQIFEQIREISFGAIPTGVVNKEVCDKRIFQAKLNEFLEAIG